MAYEDRLVTFFDVMGWRARINRAGHDEDALRYMETILLAFEVFRRVPINGREQSAFLSTFSDNVVVSFPADADRVWAWIEALARIQVGLALNGFFIRGAVTRGWLHHNEKVVFGPALNRAYEMESTLAISPRILIDENVEIPEDCEAHLAVRDGEQLAAIRSFSRQMLQKILGEQPNSDAVAEAFRDIGLQPLPPHFFEVPPEAVWQETINHLNAEIANTDVPKAKEQLLHLLKEIEADQSAEV